ncbi:hypothetical protein OEZ85_005635 [Tetradesmus obliquus]|uniref:EF-hand domain-containing protein n=1 Tax=Tetradesmus obliquus TaxID=3088 RepID=A0ABY8UEB6_TETOB|nr:hypothetical protein OEZ85_005635 [Tetradesmus obliquus]
MDVHSGSDQPAKAQARLFWLGEVLFLGWPLFSKTPGFRSCRQLHRFAWLVTSVALLVWHAVVFQVLLQQPASQWSGPLDLGTCSSQASLQALAAHGLAGRGCSTAPLLLQESSLAVLCPQAAVGGEAASQQLLEPFLHQNQPVQQLAQQQRQQQQQQLAPGALLAAWLAALLQLLAAEPHEAWSKQRSQRSKQVAAWQLLSSIMQRYLHTHSSSGSSSSSSWGTSYSQTWQQEAAAAWRQLELQVAPSKDASTVSGISSEDIMSMFSSLGSSEAAAAAAAAQAFSWLDADRGGKISQEDMQAAFAARGRSHLGLALTLSRKAELALEVQSLVHVLLQVVLVVLYLAVFELGTQLWSGIIAALVLLLLGCICMFGDAARHSLSSAHWLLTANPFSIGDTITYSSSSWLVIDFNAAATTLQCLATNIPHTVPNPSLRGSTSIANSSRCSAPTIAVRASIVGMPAAKLEQFLEHVQAAAAAAAAAQPALFVAGSCGVRLVGDRLVCNGSVDFVEAELALEWVSGCTASDSRSIAQAKAAMLQVVRQQYSCFMAPVDNTRPIPDVNMWSNPVYS